MREAIRPPRHGVVILAYHRVGAGSGLEIDLPVDLFEAQMAALEATGSVISLDRAVRTHVNRDEGGVAE